MLDHDDAFVQVNTGPLESYQLTTTTAGIDEDVSHGLPLDRNVLQSFHNFCNFFGLEVVDLFLGNLGRRCFGGRIVGNQLFLLCHRQNHRNQTVVFQDSLVRQRLEFVFNRKELTYGITQSFANFSAFA